MTHPGIPDAWLAANFTTAQGFDPNGDPDGDGINNALENQLGINPNHFDKTGPVNFGFDEEITNSPDLSFRTTMFPYPSDLYDQSSLPGWYASSGQPTEGWQADTGSHIEIWNEGIAVGGSQSSPTPASSSPYVELQSHLGGHGLKQEFNMVPGTRLNFILCYKGRYEYDAYDNAFDLKVEGASELLVDGSPVSATGTTRSKPFIDDDEWDTYAEWHYAAVSITAETGGTGLKKITLSLVPKTTTTYDYDGEKEITYGGFVDLLPIEVVDANKTAVSELKVGKMAEPGVLTNTGTLTINHDPARFFIRISGGASLGTSTVKLETIDNPVPDYNDNATEIELTAQDGDLISQSLLLVSDDVDDGFPVDDITDNLKNDRTHKIQLGGKVKISAIKIGTNAEQVMDMKTPVNVKKTVKVKMVNCRYGFFDVEPCWDPEIVTRVQKVMKERYAQVGVKLEITDAEGMVIDWTTGYLNDYPTLAGSVITIPQQSKDIIDATPVPSGDEIGLYLVRKIHQGPNGVAIIDKYTQAADKTAGYSNKAFVEVPFFPGRDGTDYTAPHEVLHILLDAEHSDYEAEFDDSNMLWHDTIQNNTIDDTKRISVTQESKVHTSPLAK